MFFFADYQGTRKNQGLDTGLISVPSVADRSGNFPNVAGAWPLHGPRVSGPSGRQLSQKLGYNVFANEPYYTAGCGSSAVRVSQCDRPAKVWSSPVQQLLQYIPFRT